ncbi:DNA (cytosine-5-)-methyltransferase [Sinorhizobium sp. B11]
MIPNHYTPALSCLDLDIVRAVPPGGNWKDIPESIPSKRLQQIRESFRRGEGSRSTYYGRMQPESPSHTISTYFNRPGNGSFVHYLQDRMISQREAARLQTFPDSFEFYGSKSAVNKQIGNAVPPLLAFQIAKHLGEKGEFIDLFAGAGGLSLGFHWAGWQQVVGNDIDASALETYKKNLGGNTVLGDVESDDVFSEIVKYAKNTGQKHDTKRLVLGGPPCQGFSTAGNKRSMEDQRNHLFKRYADILTHVQPDGFLFENVQGLKSMEGGRVLQMVLATLEQAGYATSVWTVKAEQFGVPQRRTRVIIAGTRAGTQPLFPPPPISAWGKSDMLLPPPPTVVDAISDLPPLEPGTDGSSLDYFTPPNSPFQQLMRGVISPDEYSSNVR